MFRLAAPWMLLALCLPFIVARFLRPAPSRTQAALRVPFFKDLVAWTGLSLRKKTIKNYYQYIVYAIWFLLVIAAAGPQWLGQPLAVSRAGRDLILALDISGSMQIPDMSLYGAPSTRLDVVKKVAREFVQHRMNDRLGLILFGSKAYLQTPLTFDRSTVANMIEDASIGLAGEQTAIGDAIGLAIKRLQQLNTASRSRVVVLLTDGGNNSGILSPLQAAKVAQLEGIRIYTIGIGADSLLVPGVLGNQIVNPSANLDEPTLKSIAEMTQGLFFRAKNTKALQIAYQALDQLEPVESGNAMFRPVTELYPWPLGVALVLSAFIAWGYLRRRMKS